MSLKISLWAELNELKRLRNTHPDQRAPVQEVEDQAFTADESPFAMGYGGIQIEVQQAREVHMVHSVICTDQWHWAHDHCEDQIDHHIEGFCSPVGAGCSLGGTAWPGHWATICREHIPSLWNLTYQMMDQRIHFDIGGNGIGHPQLRNFFLVQPIIGKYVRRSENEHATLFSNDNETLPCDGNRTIDWVGGRPRC